MWEYELTLCTFVVTFFLNQAIAISPISPLYLPYISPLSPSRKGASSALCSGLRSHLGLSVVER